MNNKENTKYINLPIVTIGKLKKEEKKEQNNSKIITLVFIIFIIILLLLCGYTFAKTIDNVLIKSENPISEPILIVENNPSIDITSKNNSGIYEFKVKNYNNEGKITEVDLKYYIEITSNMDEEIKLELYEDNQKVNLINNKTEYIKISKSSKQERNYKIKIQYEKGQKELTTDILDKVQIKIHTEQQKA